MNELFDDDVKKLKRIWETHITRTARRQTVIKVISILGLFLAVFVQIFFSSKIREKKYYPYIVSVNADGSYEFAGIAQKSNFDINANEAVVRKFLTLFITNLRTVSAVRSNIEKNLQTIYYFITPNLYTKLSQEIKKDNPVLLSNTIRRDVVFSSFKKIDSANYELVWNEDIRQQGNVVLQEAKKATFALTIKLPDVLVKAEQNPISIYISDYYITDLRK